MARFEPRWVLSPLAMVALAIAPPRLALASTLSSADAGTYGAPYAHLGPRSTRAWENYRKKYDTAPAQYPNPYATDAPPERVMYRDIWQGFRPPFPTGGTYQGPGLFMGTAASQRTPPNARLYIVQALQGGARVQFEFRAGFLEHLAAGGGASASAFLANVGGDLSPCADQFCGNPTGWGVDGVYLRVWLTNQGPTWVLQKLDPYAVAATSAQSNEGSRFSHAADLTVTGATPSGPDWITSISSDQPLSLEWRIRQATGDTFFELVLGGQVTVSWLLDDGATRQGLTSTGNSDAVGYQNGSLDVTRLVPAIYLNRLNDTVDITGTPETTLELGIAGAAPIIDSHPSTVVAGRPFNFTVRALDSADNPVPQYQATAVFGSTDADAGLPPTFQFTPAEGGQATLTATLNTAGIHKLLVFDAETPALEGASGDIVVLDATQLLTLLVGCDCNQGAGAVPLAVLALLWSAGRRRARSLEGEGRGRHGVRCSL